LVRCNSLWSRSSGSWWWRSASQSTPRSRSRSPNADDIDPTGVQTLQALWDNDFVPIALGVLLFLWATGISVVRSGVLPKWIGWIMILLGVVALTPIGFVSFIASAVLILVISILLALRERSAAPAKA
jgi:hypothetical protein